MRVTKSDICLELECWVDELSPAQMAAYERVANEHNSIQKALKTALGANEGKELFSGQVFQAYSFKGKVLQELKEAQLPKKPPKAAEPLAAAALARAGRKRPSNYVYLESTDEEEEDDMPLAKRIAIAQSKKMAAKNAALRQKALSSPAASNGKSSPLLSSSKIGKSVGKQSTKSKGEKSVGAAATDELGSSPPSNFKPSETTSVGGLVIGVDSKEGKDVKENKDNKETKLQGKTFPSLVVLAKPWLKVKDMSATRSKLDSKVKLVLMLTPNKFTEWLIQEGLLRAEQKCSNHRSSELKLGAYSDATKFPYTGGYVWISECCPTRFVSVFSGSIFEGAPHPPSCILKLIYHWSCQTNIQNVVQWVKVDNVYIKGVYTWLRAVCTLAVHQKCKKLGGTDKFIEVGVISLGTTSQDGQQRQVKVEVLGVLDYAERTIRLRAVEPVSDADRNYKKRFQTILEPLQRWVHKDSTICIDLTVDKMTLYSMGYKNIVQAAATDSTAKHNNSSVMDYLRRIVPRMFQNTLSLLSRQMIQQFLDELVWREQFGTYALQAFNNITSHIAEQTRMYTNETLTQRLYQVATNPFKDWSVLPPNFKDTPANTTPKRLKKPINEADYVNMEKLHAKSIKKEKEAARDSKPPTPTPTGKRRAAAAAAAATAASFAEDHRAEKKAAKSAAAVSSASKSYVSKGYASTPVTTKNGASAPKKMLIEPKFVKKEEEDMKGLEEMYYGVRDGLDVNFEPFPYRGPPGSVTANAAALSSLASALIVDCPICDIAESFDSNEKLQTHIVSHISIEGREHQFQCLFCLEKHASETVLAKHNQLMHAAETKTPNSSSYHCLICQVRCNSLHQLSQHLQKMHNMLELPYCCQACSYRSSSHRDVVRHFYDDHKGQNFLQCPFCLDIFRFAYKGRLNVSNIENYYMHLCLHVGKRDPQLHCAKCALTFNDRGSLRQHISNHHVSLLKSAQTVRLLLNNSLLISPPKVRSHHREPLPFTVSSKLPEFYAFIDGSICAECNTEIINEEHFTGLLKCHKCNYRTCCERTIYEHTATCNGTAAHDVMELPLPNEMHCVCGFSTAIGNKMADHLATCGQKSAYNSVEAALENTVKRNMLDMLGLMRRDGETGPEGTDTEGADTGVIAFGEMEAVPLLDNTQQQQQQEQEVQQQEQQQAVNMDAGVAVVDDVGVNVGVADDYGELNVTVSGVHDLQGQQQPDAVPQYHISFEAPGEGVVQQHTLNAADIDMPLIGDLADPHPPATPQFLGEVHTPMFDAVAAAEQQHYTQLMQQAQEPSSTE